VREGPDGPRGTRALARGGWAPSGRATSVAAQRERVRSTPPAPRLAPAGASGIALEMRRLVGLVIGRVCIGSGVGIGVRVFGVRS
jgi:hypothetical protein